MKRFFAALLTLTCMLSLSACREEQAAAKPSDAFELMADSPIFGTPDEFVAWNVPTTDEDSPAYKAVLLYQELLRFHAKDEDPTALADADLLRLQYGHNGAFGEEAL